MEKSGLEFMTDLFAATKNHIDFKPVIVPPELAPYALRLYEMYGQKTEKVISQGRLARKALPLSKTALFTISGGKDSLAVFLRNRDRFDEKRCFHVQGITTYVEDAEYNAARTIAEKLNFTLERLDLEFDAKTSLPESVIKNQMIYALVMDKQGATPAAIGFGGTQELGPQSMCFYHDSSDAFIRFHEFAQEAWGHHELLPFVKDEVDSFRAIYTHAPGVVDLVSSCMTPLTRKGQVRATTQERYSVQLPNEYQCGACYKCAEEQIIAKQFFGRELPEKYERFCKGVLVDKCVFETHNMNALVPHKYLTKLGITSVQELITL